MLKKAIPAVVAGLLVVSTLVYAEDHTGLKAKVSLLPINISGITATLVFRDDPDSHVLRVTGTGKGFNYGSGTNAYATLIYDAGSVATGSGACLPTGLPTPSPQQMLVGFWTVNPDGMATLTAVRKSNAYVLLQKVGTASVRLIQGPFGPTGFILKACGKVTAVPAENAASTEE